jgi:hypothetical protein
MPRKRTPKERAEITGAARTNPGRFAGRSTPWTGPLGDAPAWLSPGQVAAWEVLRAEIPWLQVTDRILVGIASIILARVMAGEDVGATLLNQLRLCMTQMGATPADRSRVASTEETRRRPIGPLFQLNLWQFRHLRAEAELGRGDPMNQADGRGPADPGQPPARRRGLIRLGKLWPAWSGSEASVHGCLAEEPRAAHRVRISTHGSLNGSLAPNARRPARRGFFSSSDPSHGASWRAAFAS